ncbi:MAG: hypothetical protein IKS62_04200 [Aeriscardovia sp.]|nr:hypothetical protein [Aeriscardovia sp.]MBR6434780.1 hypothetical protein [Aeriscardovia sp.]
MLSALFVRSSFWILTVLDALVVAGWTAIYTPIYDGASAACPQNHSGRSVGIRDLMINVSPAIGIAVHSALMDQNGFASKAFVLAGRAAAGQRNAATDLSAVEASNMFRVMAAAAAVTLLVVLCVRSHPFDRKPARGSREGSGGARARTQEPLTGLQPAARDGRNGFSRRPPPELLRAHSHSVRLHGAPGTRPYAGDLLGLRSKSKETCLNAQSNVLNPRSK